MTRGQMIEYITKNPYSPVIHNLFSDDEFIYTGRNGNVYDENGYLFEDWYSEGPGKHDGIRDRVGGIWEAGWNYK